MDNVKFVRSTHYKHNGFCLLSLFCIWFAEIVFLVWCVGVLCNGCSIAFSDIILTYGWYNIMLYVDFWDAMKRFGSKPKHLPATYRSSPVIFTCLSIANILPKHIHIEWKCTWANFYLEFLLFFFFVAKLQWEFKNSKSKIGNFMRFRWIVMWYILTLCINSIRTTVKQKQGDTNK